jgi:hypothetical protein
VFGGSRRCIHEFLHDFKLFLNRHRLATFFAPILIPGKGVSG